LGNNKFGPTSASGAFYRRIFDLYDAAPGGNKVASGITPTDLGCAGFSLPNGLGTTIPCSRGFIKTRGRPSQDALTSGRMDWNLGSNDRAFSRIQGQHGLGAFASDAINSVFELITTYHCGKDNWLRHTRLVQQRRVSSWWQGLTTHSLGK